MLITSDVSSQNPNTKTINSQTDKYCSFHDSETHNTSDCIAKRRVETQNRHSSIKKPKTNFTTTKPLGFTTTNPTTKQTSVNKTNNQQEYYKVNKDTNTFNMIETFDNTFYTTHKSVQFKIQLDFGSSLSYISTQAASAISLTPKSIQPIVVTVADGRTISTTRKYNLQLNLFDESPLKPVDLHAMEGCNFDIILGRDFMKLNSVDILHSTGTIMVNGKKISHHQNFTLNTSPSEPLTAPETVNKLLLEYSSYIDTSKPITGVKFEIPLTLDLIVSKKSYPIAFHLYERLKKHVNMLISRNIISHSQSFFFKPVIRQIETRRKHKIVNRLSCAQ